MEEKELENCIIQKFFKIYDYYQMFTNKFIMNIENPFNIEYLGKIIKYKDIDNFLSENKDIFDYSIIKNCKIKENIEFILEMSNGIILRIFLDDDNEITSEPVYIKFIENNKTVIIGWKDNI